MTVNPGIFKAYDIRGVYGDDIDLDTAGLIGRAFARHPQERGVHFQIVIADDTVLHREGAGKLGEIGALLRAALAGNVADKRGQG